MMSRKGISDKVAVIGMGCTRFAEHWDKSVDDLLIEAAYEAFEDAGIEPTDIEAANSYVPETKAPEKPTQTDSSQIHLETNSSETQSETNLIRDNN